VALHVDHSLRQHLDFGPDPHAGLDAEWMATTGLGYLDRFLAETRVAPVVEPVVATDVHYAYPLARLSDHAALAATFELERAARASPR